MILELKDLVKRIDIYQNITGITTKSNKYIGLVYLKNKVTNEDCGTGYINTSERAYIATIGLFNHTLSYEKCVIYTDIFRYSKKDIFEHICR